MVTRGGRIVWLRGQCPQNLDDGRNIDSHDPVEQTHKVMQSIRQLIEEAGGSMEHLVKVVVYITDVRHREAVCRTMGAYIKGVHPVSTGLVVHAIAEIRQGQRFMKYRQVLAVDGNGGTAIHSGPNLLGLWTQAQTQDVASGGNLSANDGVPQAISATG